MLGVVAVSFTADQRVLMADVNEAFVEAAKRAHPDAGGNHDEMARLSEAKAFAKKELEAVRG